MLASKKILVLAPHTDDGELGCGASLSKFISAGKEVLYLAFSGCAQSLPAGLPPDTLLKECRQATKTLGIAETRILDFEVRRFPQYRQEILEAMVATQREWQPDAVLLPSCHDRHQDHQVIYAEGLRAFKHCTILGYELPWNQTEFAPVYFEPLSEDNLRRKQEALESYQSQSQRDYMKADFMRSLAVVRGLQAGTSLAEAFEIYRMIG